MKDALIGSTLLWKSNWLSQTLLKIQPWTVHVDGEIPVPSLRVWQAANRTAIALASIKEVRIQPGLLWSKVLIKTAESQHTFAGIWFWEPSEPAERLKKLVSQELKRQLSSMHAPLAKFETQVRYFLAQDRYLRHSDVSRFQATVKEISEPLQDRLFKLIEHPFAREIEERHALRQRLVAATSSCIPRSYSIRSRNDSFVKKELDSFRDFFDNIETSPLTEEQRHAAVVFEDRNLLVAAAGSGKSSTLVGKAAYALCRGIFEADEIVALAFNKKAAKELRERIDQRIKPLRPQATIGAHTFHGLGFKILRAVAKAQGQRVRPAKPESEKPRLQAVLNELLRSADFAQDWMLFLSLCREPVPADNAFESFTDYERYVERQRTKRKTGESVTFQALTGDLVRSVQELSIANWLYLNNVPFEYEKPFEPLPPTWDKFQPDFYLPEINVWYEHFGLDAHGRAPRYFRDNYAQEAQSKREWMKAHATGRFIETRSHQYFDGSLFKELHRMLQQRGQHIKARSTEEALAKIKSLGQADALNLVLEVLHLVKSNGISQSQFAERARSLVDQVRASLFTKVFWPIYFAYNDRLKREGLVDYDDMIIQAAQHLEHGQFVSPHQLVLVDEFQDLSIGRSRLVKALLAGKPKGILFGVGDDWQAINGFAGSDLQLFMNFEAEFGPTHEGELTQTFRCAQGIADVSSTFIQRNKDGQKTKKVVSKLDSNNNGVVDLIDITRDDDTARELEARLAELASKSRTASAQNANAKKWSVFLLSRYGLDKTKGISQKWLDVISSLHADALEIEFTTMHKSKGLEADYVFLLGLNSGMGLTFPSIFLKDPLVEMLLSTSDRFPHAEERRLFYVALTRAKRRCSIIFRQLSPSPFVLELMAPNNKGMVTLRGDDLPQPCSCRKGYMVKRLGPWKPFLGCTRFQSDQCLNTLRISNAK